jgi:hypothetical protein
MKIQTVDLAARLVLFVAVFCGMPTACRDQAQAPLTAELSPHFDGKAFQYVGDFHGNYVYLVKGEGGELGGELKDSKYVCNVTSAREQLYVIFRRPNDGKVAVFDPSDPSSQNFKHADLDFQTPEYDTVATKAWERASNPEKFQADRRVGKSQEWITVDVGAQERQVERTYCGAEIKTNAASELQFIPLLLVTEERFTLYLDPANNKFAVTQTDYFGTPLEPIKDREMTSDGMGIAVWKLLKASLGK